MELVASVLRGMGFFCVVLYSCEYVHIRFADIKSPRRDWQSSEANACIDIMLKWRDLMPRTLSSQYRLSRHKTIPPFLCRVLVRPAQQCIVVYALMNRAPTGTSLSLALERSIAGTHQRLADVVEAVRRVVLDFLREIRAAVALLEVLHEVGLEEVTVSMYW